MKYETSLKVQDLKIFFDVHCTGYFLKIVLI